MLKLAQKLTYHDFLQQVYFDTADADLALIDELLEKIKPLANLPLPFAPSVFALDYRTKKYVFWAENSPHFFPAQQQLAEGLTGVLDTMDPRFLQSLNENLFPAIHSALRNKNKDEDLYFSFNHRVIKEGRSIDVFQKGTYICSSETGLPLYVIGICWDISAFKRDNFQILSIESVCKKTGKITLLGNNCFNTEINNVQISEREKNIVHYLLDGNSSKMIADKLSISISTVNNHRQHILRKTNCKNVAELMGFVSRMDL